VKTIVIRILFSIFLCSAIFFALGQTNWKLTKDKGGIRIFQRDIKNSNFKSIRVECTLQGNFDRLIAIINNVSDYKDWVYNNKMTSLLKRIGPYEFYYYTEAYLPWPLDNRDAVMHTTITRDSLNRFIKINSTAVPNYAAQKSGKVRIKKSNINWYVTRPSSNTIQIIYTFETDPGGNVPVWLVNSFADKGPYESFKKLAELLEK
jgi:hypothetical protein